MYILCTLIKTRTHFCSKTIAQGWFDCVFGFSVAWHGPVACFRLCGSDFGNLRHRGGMW